MPKNHTTRPFTEALPEICERQGVTFRELARTLDIHHSVIGRMLDGTRPAQPDLIAEISEYLGLAQDYFPEVRLARIVDALIDHPRLRDEIYFNRIRGGSSRRNE